MSARASSNLPVVTFVALVGLLTGFVSDSAQVRGARAQELDKGFVDGDSLQNALEGEWGWVADGPGCNDNPHTVSLTPDRRHMIVTYRDAFDSTGALSKRYEIRSRSPRRIRAFMISPAETRRTPAGEPVVWDLVITAPDVYQWHRTDWPEGGLTRAIIRCSDWRAPASDPEGTARLFLEALAAQEFMVAALLTDPAELRRDRLAFDSLLVADTANYLSRRIFRVDSVAQLRRMSDAEFSAHLETFTSLLRADPAYWANVRGAEVIGSVRQGADTAHVVYRWRFPSDSLPMRSTQATTMIRSGGRWWAQMLSNYRPLIALLKEPLVPIEISRPPRPEQRQ